MYTIKKNILTRYRNYKISKRPKIFGIGANKTGTTSLTKAMVELGYTVGNQKIAQTRLIRPWSKRNFKEIIDYCKTAEFFQDQPFSLQFTYVALDQAFPNSKFILTVRDNPEQWYDSLIGYMARKYGKDGRIPTKLDLMEADDGIKKGNLWETACLLRKVEETNIYDKGSLIAAYQTRNAGIIEYFRHRPDDLLILNVSEKNAYKKLYKFLGKTTNKKNFPHLNKTSAI